jgi:type VI secretion system secreted protein Hcp
MSKLLTGVFAIGLMLIWQVSVSHALPEIRIYMLLPGIQGEATEPNHIGWINVESVNWGHGEAPPGSPNKIQFKGVYFVKFIDSTSASLALLGATGQLTKDVKLEITTPAGNAVPGVLSRMKLTNARVVSYIAGAHDGPGNPTDNITFSFDTITWINFRQSPTTGQMTPGSAACWDVVNNKVCVPQF